MPRLVVALDYGTSNSGAAYAIVPDDGQPSDSTSYIDVVKSWPRAGANRDSSEKVSSDIAYDKDGGAIGHGFEASRHKKATVLQWVKLLLEPDSFQKDFDKDGPDRTSKAWDAYNIVGSPVLPKKPVDVVADYLRWLWNRVRDIITEKEDADAALFAPERLTVVLTVPASWSATARQRMAIAAVIAGIPEACIKTLTEPEAAAVYGLKKKAQQAAIQESDCVIILDAGGGTVDAVAYRVLKRNPLSLDQVTTPDGNFCGSSFVNKQFKNQVQQMLGEKYDVLSQKTKREIDDVFEYEIKRTYDPSKNNTDPPSEIPVDGLEDDDELNIQEGSMTLDPAVIESAFDSVMPQIMGLIDDQIQSLEQNGHSQALKGLLLVGGFGKSGYLLHRIRQEFGARKGMKVWAADNSWTAVVQGAVDWEVSAIGQQALINSRLSGCNYGIPFVDDGRRKVHWLVRKGQSIKTNMCTEPYGLRIDYQEWLDVDETCLVYVPIVISSATEIDGDYTDDVMPHAEIKCRVPTSLRFRGGSKEIQGRGVRAWLIPAKLVLYFDGALISFRCQIEDKEVGVAQVAYLGHEHEFGCATSEDLRSRSGSQPSNKSIVDSVLKDESNPGKISAPNDSSSEDETVVAGPSKSIESTRPSRQERLASAPAALNSSNETAPISQSLTPLVVSRTQQAPPKPKHHFFGGGLRTLRDTQTKAHYAFLGPSAAMELPVEERVRAISRKGWEPRSDYKKKKKGGGKG